MVKLSTEPGQSVNAHCSGTEKKEGTSNVHGPFSVPKGNVVTEGWGMGFLAA